MLSLPSRIARIQPRAWLGTGAKGRSREEAAPRASRARSAQLLLSVIRAGQADLHLGSKRELVASSPHV